MKNVVVLMTDDDAGLWSIYEESGQALEFDFESEQQAIEFANQQNWNIVKYFTHTL
tara:strand:- start:1454 stop:1621 length:168 start_codon:yes stop_codon:yes gene_type:complete